MAVALTEPAVRAALKRAEADKVRIEVVDATASGLRNVSTTLIQPGLEFKLWCSALVRRLCEVVTHFPLCQMRPLGPVRSSCLGSA
jgi:hypothetical protein